MANIYIDESGSMTHKITKNNKLFVTTLMLVKKLKDIDRVNKMFDGDKFVELKGSAFDPAMKRNFVNYFCRNNHFQILYITVDNSKATENLYKNKARAFNYILKLAFEHLSNKGILDRNWVLNIDERNVKTDAKYQLQEYLCTELSTGKDIVDVISIQYFNSSANRIIQLADVFSNVLYSNILTKGSYYNEIQYMNDNGYLINIFKFPIDD
jgi:hypothetical protein